MFRPVDSKYPIDLYNVGIGSIVRGESDYLIVSDGRINGKRVYLLDLTNFTLEGGIDVEHVEFLSEKEFYKLVSMTTDAEFLTKSEWKIDKSGLKLGSTLETFVTEHLEGQFP